ncbi:putative RNA-binding protein with PUA-like domain [Alteromonadaceae bacterium 2753L.S.0a.02]|nr:putative RNA-binding protein with PUA-like domain [Alteromonadaceae bacterium 2753L.S.0a.02]
MSIWLFKTEPGEYSIDDLAKEQQTRWNGIRNYQARNLLRDEVQLQDRVFIYHSSCKPTAIVGLAVVCKTAYPDPSQFDESDNYYDVKATPTKPRWFCVDIEFREKFRQPLTLSRLKEMASLKDMVLLKQGRLSIQPVSEAEYQAIILASS